MNSRPNFLVWGIFLTAQATLIAEILNGRLLSVLTWYHLSFLAISVAMLGLGAGGIHVYLFSHGQKDEKVLQHLPVLSLVFSLSIPLFHILLLDQKVANSRIATIVDIARVTVLTGTLVVPFYLAGLTLTIALFFSKQPIARLYAFDLIGAALGCLIAILLLETTNITAGVFAAAGVAFAGHACFLRQAGRRNGFTLPIGLLLVALFMIQAWVFPDWLRPRFAKGAPLPWARIQKTFWNSHSFVTVEKPVTGLPFFWGPGLGAEQMQAVSSNLIIDGEAGTSATHWDGDPASLFWTEFDVTYLPYTIRQGEVAVIGVGGGRDLLAALHSGATAVTGIEINKTFIHLLEHDFRSFTRLVDSARLHLVHEEGRSWFTRSQQKFDVIQMSLVDTWASTGAGAFTLTENGLYTREAWRVFVKALKPDGILSVSRWFSPKNLSETSRLVALASAALLDAGIPDVSKHIILVSRGGVATLILGKNAFSTENLHTIREISTKRGFEIVALPNQISNLPLNEKILSSRNLAQLEHNTEHPTFDFRPPTDERPFFFNLLKMTASLQDFDRNEISVFSGNLYATRVLFFLFFVVMGLTALLIFGPLLSRGLPDLSFTAFASAVVYFSAIGLAYMLVQIALLQRFSIFLGHPIYSLSVILFSMILFTGLGSLTSDRLALNRWILAIPLVVGGLLLILCTTLRPLIEANIEGRIAWRSAIVICSIAPVAWLQGFCFPLGMRLIGKISRHATAWMWGVNGAMGVMGSVIAVMISIWLGILPNILIAAGLYLTLLIPMLALIRARNGVHS